MKLLAIIVPLAVLLLCAPRCSSQDGQDGVDEALIPSLPTEPLEDIPEESASDIRTPDGDAEVPTEDIAPDDAGDTLTVDSTEDADNTVTNDKTEAEDRKPLPAAVNKDKDAIPEPSWNRSALVWYRAGVDAYLDENWRECRRTLENALAEWHFFRRANIDCRLQCGDEARRAQPLFPEDVEHLHFAEEMVRATLCILKCKRRAFEGRATPHALPADQQQPFRDLKPYEYIQLCYYQLAEYQKAASAVYTILMHDPDNEIMRNNLKFYLGVPEVDETAIINYESEKYISLYLEGTEAYYLEDYDTAIRKLEASLKEFLKANEECRADCDGPFDQGWLPDFTSSVANHFVFCLKCKTKCRMQLSQLNGEKYEDFLPIHYNYLQFAYYKAGKLNKACAAAATYLLFFPADETMLENVNIYKALPKVNTDMFRPLEDAVNYLKRQTYEEALLRYISDEFVFDDTKKDTKPPQKDEE